ncbi:MAG TPA: hypothetical protein VGD81_16485, partial [Opitutaceae bacterium]
HLLRAWFYSQPLADTEHRVRIELLATKLDKAAVMKRAGTLIDDPSPYDGHGLYLCGLLPVGEPLTAAGPEVALADAASRVTWEHSPEGWRLRSADVQTPAGAVPVGTPAGDYTLLYSPEKPPAEPVPVFWTGHDGEAFPEKIYRYTTPTWREATIPVALNTAGEAYRFFPAQFEREPDGSLAFSHETEVAAVRAGWRLDPAFPGDVQVTLTLTARRAGYFSIATPSLATLAPADLAWAMVPGYFQGAAFNSDLVLALAYGHGLPGRPVVVRERAASTLSPLMTNRSGATLAVVPEPGTAADPWTGERDTRSVWRLGLSHLNRQGALSPTLYHPVLGQDGSHLEAGETRTFRFRYVLRAGDWFTAVKHAACDIYRLDDFLALKQPQRSLSERLLALHGYVTDDRTSLWRTETFGGLEIGAQAYLGGVVGSDKDAMKNSDYGAMWMLARLTDDPRLTRDRLPFARNFKLVQQQREPGFFQGAAIGQYYLSKSRRFTEEWGDYVEPVALTYYVMLDLGNILLFNPADGELRERLRLAADRLLAWQHADGRWAVAYDHATQRERFTELPDVRPTFYGLLIAYRLLGDEKYLAAARRGADWLLANAVAPGRFLGVCGDNRFAPDFATAQIAEALLMLHELTGEVRYRDAAIATARFYTTSIYTHPVATADRKKIGGVERADWEINQSGLGFEHGGVIGSANRGGPILLASHAGLFIRMHALTGEPFFRDLARAAAWARDAFVDPATSVASYYWNAMNKGAGPYPHHAWWQIGWITDYLIAEASLRSGGAIEFPRGFMTPKVGPHTSYGFAPGKVFGATARLLWGRVETGNPSVDYLVAGDDGARRRWIILLNNRVAPGRATVTAPPAELGLDAAASWKNASLLSANGVRSPLGQEGRWTVELPATGLAVLELKY